MRPLIVVPLYLARPMDLEVATIMVRSLALTCDEGDLLVVDDCSPVQALVDELETGLARSGLTSEVVRQPSNEGFSRTVNVGLRRALEEGRDAVLANADLEFLRVGWLTEMLRDPADVVGALLVYPFGIIQHAGCFFSLLYRTFGHLYQYGPRNLPEAQERRVCPVTGALQLIRHETLEHVGLYDEDFRMGFEDMDYCVRVFESGRTCAYNPKVEAVHHESLFRGTADPDSKLAKWQAAAWPTFMMKHKTTNMAPYIPSFL